MRSNIFVLFCSIGSIFIVSAQNNNPSGHGSQALAVETQRPNTDYKPAFVGQTRVGGIKTSTPYKVEKLAENIGRPWGIVPLPDDRFLISQKSGYVELRSSSGALLKKISGFPSVDDGGQGGMLDICLDPNFVNNHLIYWSFSEKHGDKNLTAVGKGFLDESSAKIRNPIVIFRATPALESNLHFGSRLVFDSSGYLYVSTGERSILEGRRQAQLLSSCLGKVFRITTDGKPAPNNPFIGRKGAFPEIYCYGNRNVQSLDIHPSTGELWACEFGPQGGDELNIIKSGKNYGWPIITYGIEYSGKAIGDKIQQKEGMEQPVYYWDPVISPSGMAFYGGNEIPEWHNNLFIGGLSGMHICRLVIKGNRVVGEERILSDKKERFRDIAYHKGALYVVTDSGSFYKISKNQLTIEN